MLVVLSTLQDGASPLAVASQDGHREIVQMLIDHGANVNSQQKVCIILWIPSLVSISTSAWN